VPDTGELIERSCGRKLIVAFLHANRYPPQAAASEIDTLLMTIGVTPVENVSPQFRHDVFRLHLTKTTRDFAKLHGYA
jgi:hypothetical protein